MHQSVSELEMWYPRILDAVQLLWGTTELNSYLGEILIMDRDREGFPDEVWSELFTLYLVNIENTAPAKTDIWFNRR